MIRFKIPLIKITLETSYQFDIYEFFHDLVDCHNDGGMFFKAKMLFLKEPLTSIWISKQLNAAGFEGLFACHFTSVKCNTMDHIAQRKFCLSKRFNFILQKYNILIIVSYLYQARRKEANTKKSR
jgi:hypothetical protein